jgi:hypothetical protein
MTPLQLESFCGPRLPLNRPATFGDHDYAFDGSLLVRIPHAAGHTFPPGVATPDFAKAWSAWPHPADGWEPLHPLPSPLSQWTCRCCGQSLPPDLASAENPWADSTPVAQAIAIGQGHYSSLYLRRLLDAGLPQLEAVSLGHGRPLLLRWTGGEAILAAFNPTA